MNTTREAWHVESSGPVEDPSFAVRDENGLLVASLGSGHEDARLIAAAPDLLDALQNALATVDEIRDGSDPSFDEVEAIRAQIADAIAKATGGEA